MYHYFIKKTRKELFEGSQKYRTWPHCALLTDYMYISSKVIKIYPWKFLSFHYIPIIPKFGETIIFVYVMKTTFMWYMLEKSNRRARPVLTSERALHNWWSYYKISYVPIDPAHCGRLGGQKKLWPQCVKRNVRGYTKQTGEFFE